jgi:pimeloyl-ACP methyl ester carboxylesterase
MVTPPTQYARSGSAHIAYQVVGEGPIDLVFVRGWFSHLELDWEWPELARFHRRLAGIGRLILFDKRGTGMSDRAPSSELPTLEQRMDDVRAVLDAVGSERVALLGLSEGGPMSVLFAATYPERTRALVLMSSMARTGLAPDYSIGVTPDVFEALLARLEAGWGRGVGIHFLAASLADDPVNRQAFARYQRMAVSPGAAIDLLRMVAQIDVRPILAAIRVPALVLHRSGDRFTPVEWGRYLGAHIPGARYVELPGPDHVPWAGDAEAVLGEIQEFLTGMREPPESERVLATVLFLDIVGSTEQAAALGDQRWRERLESFYALVRGELQRMRGREVDTAGDGMLATFDGPARAVRCGLAVAAAVRRLGLAVRAGVHTGECEIMGDKLGGIAVHLGARVAGTAGPGEVLVSQTVRDLVAGSGLRFEDRGVHALKGIPEAWRLFGAIA